MPLLLIGLFAGAGGTYFLSDKAASLVKWTVVGGALYVGYSVLVKK